MTPLDLIREAARESREREEKATEIEFLPGYVLTETGHVISISSNWRGYGKRRLAEHRDDHGYLMVRISCPDGERRKFRIHQLVAQLFIGPKPSSAHQVRHLDGDRTNNHRGNIAWGTARENADDRNQHGTTATGERNGQSRLSEAIVSEIRSALSCGQGRRALALKYGVTPQAISLISKGETWKHVR